MSLAGHKTSAAPPPTISALASLLSAAFDHAALAITGGADQAIYRAAMLTLIERGIGSE